MFVLRSGFTRSPQRQYKDPWPCGQPMPRLRLPPSFADTTSSSSSATSIPSPAPHPSVPRVDPPLHSSMINLGRINCRILKRIPCGSRAPCAEKLSSILDDIVKDNDKEAWNRLFLFSRWCLAQPSRGGHRRSLATCINQAIEREEDSPSNSRQNHSMSLAKRVSAKMEMSGEQYVWSAQSSLCVRRMRRH